MGDSWKFAIRAETNAVDAWLRIGTHGAWSVTM